MAVKRILVILTAMALAMLLFTACNGDDPTQTEPDTSAGETVPAGITDLTEGTTLDGETMEEGESTSEGETTEEEASTDEEGNTVATSAGETKAINMTKGQILAEYTKVMDAVKVRQPTYNYYDYQKITNEHELNKDVIEMLNTYFYKGGAQSLVPLIEDLFDSRQLLAEKDASVSTRNHHTGDNGERLPGGKSNARWFGVSMNDRGCLAKESDIKGMPVIKDIGNDRRQIDFVIADARNPVAISEGAATAPNSIAAFMEVVDISVVFTLVDNPITRTAIRAAGVNLTADSYMMCTGSTVRMIYNAKTMELEYLYQVGRLQLFLDGTVKGVECKGVPVKIDCVFEFTKFQWNTAYKS